MGRRRDADDAHGGRGSEASANAPPAAAGEEGLTREFSTLRRELEAVSKALVRTPEDERRLARKGVITGTCVVGAYREVPGGAGGWRHKGVDGGQGGPSAGVAAKASVGRLWGVGCGRGVIFCRRVLRGGKRR